MKLKKSIVSNSVKKALLEDGYENDLSLKAKSINSKKVLRASLISRENGILSGGLWFEESFKQIDSKAQIKWNVFEGGTFKKDNILTFNAIVIFDNNWSIISSYANRRIANGGGLIVRDSLTEIAAGYDFNRINYFDGLQFQLGYARSNQKDRSLSVFRDNDSLFGLIRYVKNL